MRLAVPTDPLVDPLVEHAEDVCSRLGWTLLRVPEEQCEELLLANRVDAALLTPLAYGRAAGVVEYNIVKGACVALYDFTNVAGVYFPNEVSEIRTVGSTTPNDFLVHMGAILLRERFESTSITITQTVESAGAAPDCVIERITSTEHAATLDVSEEFTDLAECPLPLYLWVCRMDADIDQLPDALLAMSDAQLLEYTVTEELQIHDEHIYRDGKVIFRWNAEIEEGLTATLNLLYFHQLLTVMPEIKILGEADTTD